MPLPILTGRKIILRQLRRSDAEDIRKNANNRKVSRYMTVMPYPYELSHARSWIEKSLRLNRSRTQLHYGIVNRDTDRVAGMIGLRAIDFTNGNAEIGYWLGQDYWNKGLTTEAIRLMMEFAFKELKLKRLYAVVLSLNAASYRVLEKSGFIREGIWRKAHVIGRRRHDVYAYGILREEFID